MIEDVSLIVVGAVLALLSTWLKSIWDRKSTSSNTLFEMRFSAIDKIWQSFLKVKTAYGHKIPLGHDNWLRMHKEESINLLIEFKQVLDQNQVILDHSITEGFRNLLNYMQDLLYRDDQAPSEYIDELNRQLAILSDVINKSMGTRTHIVKLKLQQ